MSHVETFDRVIEEFMHGDFRGDMEGLLPWLRPNVSSGVTRAIADMEQTWSEYRAVCSRPWGRIRRSPASSMPPSTTWPITPSWSRPPKPSTESLRRWAAAEHRKVMRVSLLLVVVAGSLLTLLILAVLYVRTLAPLKRTIAGIQRVADGDFGHRIPVGGSSEVRQLTESFNGSPDASTSCSTLSSACNAATTRRSHLLPEPGVSDLLRIDWIGVVLLSGDGTTCAWK